MLLGDVSVTLAAEMWYNLGLAQKESIPCCVRIAKQQSLQCS